MIKAVIFDIDGVLLDSFEANLKFYQDLMVEVGHQGRPTREEFPRLFHMNIWDMIKKLTKLESEEEIRKIWELGRTKIPHYRQLLKMPNGAQEVIRILSKDYVIGVVSSRVRRGIEEFFEVSKLKEYFKAAVAYEDTENHKPHPEPLLLAMKQLNVKPEEAVYVGDVESDIQAAKAAGMKVIIYSPTSIEGADLNTSDFKEIPGLVKTL